MKRLFGCTVSMIYEDERGEARVSSLVADHAEFWWNERKPNESSLWESKIYLGEQFFNEITRHPVPLDMNTLTALKRSPLGLDLYLWLVYRTLRQIPYAETRQEAEQVKGRFQHWCGKRGLEAAADLIDQDWDRMVTFYNYPKQQWQHLRTTNPVESPFSALRLRTDASRRFKKVANARAVIWKMLLVAEKRFRRLKAPHLMKDVYQGAQYVNGVPVNQVTEEKAA